MSLRERLDALATIGATGSSGVSRLAWSPALSEAMAWLVEQLKDAGLEAEVDEAGNVIGRWPGSPGQKAVALGSHIDTVPNGGRFDGALGVLGGLEVIERLRAEGLRPRRPIWVLAFMDEEGARFGSSMFGSRAFAGAELSTALSLSDADGMTVAEAMRGFGLDPGTVPQASRVDELAHYLELHIEQGPQLDSTGVDLGIVTDVAGVLEAMVELRGRANHAGTTPMRLRQDALVAASRVIVALRERATREPEMSATTGLIEVKPGAANVIPEHCRFSVDMRSPSPERFQGLIDLLKTAVRDVSEDEGVDASVEIVNSTAPVRFDEVVLEQLEEAATQERVSHTRLISGAGHDAMVLAPHVSSGMLFVPSRRGLSHSPVEDTDIEHCEKAVRVLVRTVRALAGSR